MSLYMQFLWFSTLTITAYAIFRGAAPERRAGLAMVIWFLADPIYHRFFGITDFRFVDPGHLVMDGIQLFILGAIALRANRIWPLWAAAGQLVTMSGHIALLLVPKGGVTSAYWAVTQLPFFPQLAALMLGTIAHERRLRRIGACRDWRMA